MNINLPRRRGLFSGSVSDRPNLGSLPAPEPASPRRRGLFGFLSQDNLNRQNQAGITRGEQLGAMLMSLAGPQHQGAAMGMLANRRGEARHRADQERAAEQEQQRQAAERMARIQRAQGMGLQGRERELFIANNGAWAEATGDNMYRSRSAGSYDITPEGSTYLEDPIANRQEDRNDRRSEADIRNINSQIGDRAEDNLMAQDRFALDALNIESQIIDRQADNDRADRAASDTRQFNAQQSAAAEFARRAIQANDIIGDISNSGEFDPTARARFRNLPVVGDTLRGDTARQWDQATEQFALSVLRRESGAAISPQERVEIQQTYFPQPGDGPETIRQKAIARQTVIEGMVQASQGAYEHFYPAEQVSPVSGGLSPEEMRELEQLRAWRDGQL